MADLRRHLAYAEPASPGAGYLTARYQVAYYTGTVGQNAEAQRLFQAVAADTERVLGPDDPLTRSTRRAVEAWSWAEAKRGPLAQLLKRARGGDEIARMRLPAELRPLVDEDQDGP